MPRIKIELPRKFKFSCIIPVRITDINYGDHVGNDTVLSILHEARMQYLNSLGYTELNFEGIGMIMSDAAIEFKKEMVYGDMVNAFVTTGEISKIGFELIYKLEVDDKITVVAKTNMICFDYPKKKVIGIPEPALKKLMGSN